MYRVAFQGERGAYSEEAAMKYFVSKIKLIPCQTLFDLFKTVKHVDYGVVPIENSIEGNVSQTYDLLLSSGLSIVGETIHRISHCLISDPNAKEGEIKDVYSHPQALGQCREYLEKHKLNPIPFYDTAGSVKMLKEKRLLNAAAIASERAAKIYVMKILKKEIETNKHNYTRFFVISKDGRTNVTGGDKTSIAFSTKHIPGALHKALGCLAYGDINLTYIQSRPILGKPWEYNFYIDFEGHIKEKRVKDALKMLKKITLFVKVLGSYKAADKHM
jgi:prephenate dehydratase